MLEEKIKIKKIKPENQKTKKQIEESKKHQKIKPTMLPLTYIQSMLPSWPQKRQHKGHQGPSRAIVVVVDDPLLEGAVPSKYRNGVAGFRKIYASLPISNEPLCAQWGLQGYLYKKQDETGGVWLGRT